jgi:hypothetical protein
VARAGGQQQQRDKVGVVLPQEDIERIAEGVIHRIKELRRVDDIARAVLARSGESVRVPTYCRIPIGGDTYTCDEGYVCDQEFRCQRQGQTNYFKCIGEGQEEFHCQVIFQCTAQGDESAKFDCTNFTCAGASGDQYYVCPDVFSCGENDVNFRCGLQEDDVFLCAPQDGTFECRVPGEAGDFVCSYYFACGLADPTGSPTFRCDRPDPFACAQYECPEHTTFSEG